MAETSFDAVAGALNSNFANIGNVCYSSSSVTSNCKYTPTVKGKYLVIARANASTTSTQASIQISSTGKQTCYAMGAVGGNTVCVFCEEINANVDINISFTNITPSVGYNSVTIIRLQ